MGSEPKCGSSSTEKPESSKPGRGSKRSLTEEIGTGRPMLRPMASAILCWYRLILTRGGNTKATSASKRAARTIHRRGEGRFSSPPILTDQVQRSAPAGLVEEVQDYVGIERKLVSQSLFFILIVGLDERPVDEQW